MNFLTDVAYSDDPLRIKINHHYRADETTVIKALLKTIQLSLQNQQRITRTATHLVKKIRQNRKKSGGLDAFMHEYDLSSEEGILLMCLAESFLRIPDTETADKLIADKIGAADWEKHLGKSHSVFTNASTWALMLTGNLIDHQGYIEKIEKPLGHVLQSLSEKLGEPVIRESVRQGMHIIARQFVLGSTIEMALQRSLPLQRQGYSFSYDMLGETAYTEADAERYFQTYQFAIQYIGQHHKTEDDNDIKSIPGISIKLSALHPRYECSQHERVKKELLVKLLTLVEMAKHANILLTIDAEEAETLELSFDLLEAILEETSTENWQGLGLALQAYQKRAYPAIDWLEQLAIRHQCRLHIRLVKGAYWDTEIKRAQQQGLNNYPVFTRKVNTDISYLACANRLLKTDASIYPQFASHNAQTVASILEMASLQDDSREFEFQRLQGMGDTLYEALNRHTPMHCRIYAPVGNHHDLLPYLVRRLLENGANTSFINRVHDDQLPIETMVENPFQTVSLLKKIPHPDIPLPGNLYQSHRANASGLDLTDAFALQKLKQDMQAMFQVPYQATSLISDEQRKQEEFKGDQTERTTKQQKKIEMLNPADNTDVVGVVEHANQQAVIVAVKNAAKAADNWDRTPAEIRSGLLRQIAKHYEQHLADLIALLVRESGKTIKDALSEVREAIDFCHYYAYRCEQDFSQPIHLTGYTGESNTLRWHGRGVFACISPWNFPLAIFTGQITAALAAGNTVIAKPATQTPLIAHFACQLMYKAGIPPDVLQLLIGEGSNTGTQLIAQPDLAGVAFTGGIDTAQQIQRNLADRKGQIIPLIAETRRDQCDDC